MNRFSCIVLSAACAIGWMAPGTASGGDLIVRSGGKIIVRDQVTVTDGNLVLEPTAEVEMDLSGKITATTVTYDGTLTVNLVGGTPTEGSIFQLFAANTYTGAFDTITLPTLSGGLFWFPTLLVDGSITSGSSINTYNVWIGGYELAGLTGLGDDPDGDGNDNGVENYFGTNPGAFTVGLVSGGVIGNTFTFTHPLSDSPADDLTASYCWSTDMEAFNSNGEANGAGTTTVSFSQGTPSGGMVNVTATITGTVIPDKLFVNVKVTRE